MRHISPYPFLATALLALSTGCASLQTDAPLDVDSTTEQSRTDYIDDRIDDRIDENLEQMVDEEVEERIDDRVEDRVDERFDEEFDDEFDDEFDERARRQRYLDSLPLRQITLYAAYRDFTDDRIFGRVDDEVALGIEYAHEVDNGIGFEVGALGSLGLDGGLSGATDVTGAAAELYGGGRYFFKFDNSAWRPYVGVGLSAIIAGVDDDQGNNVADDQDFTFGVYAHGGVQYDITRALYLALDVRGVFATDLNLEQVSGDADYFQIGLGFGFNL